MRTISYFVGIAGILFLSLGCDALKGGVTIKGKISGAENLQAFIDKTIIGKVNVVLDKTEIDGTGSFKINFPKGLAAGIYNVRIGAKRMLMVLNGSEKEISIDGSLESLDQYSFTINGSPETAQLKDLIQGLQSQQKTANDVVTFIEQAENPMLGALVANMVFGQSPDYLPLQKKAYDKLVAKYPKDELTTAFGEFIALKEQENAAAMSQQLIQVGQPAPEIALPDPTGKIRKLSDLKGQVVLLDFWASWCGPCRRENPNVVAVYEKYKNKGFTIFSVSLDGLDDRTMSRLEDPSMASTYIAQGKQAWIDAIAIDKLSWPHHVSDLKKWSSAAAALYGVNSIPRAFMLDKNGVIVSTSVRGSQEIESTLVKLLE
jgi:thiol-disulfide isomerase/thioredoxin